MHYKPLNVAIIYPSSVNFATFVTLRLRLAHLLLLFFLMLVVPDEQSLAGESTALKNGGRKKNGFRKGKPLGGEVKHLA
jgi:hypothetical protein